VTLDPSTLRRRLEVGRLVLGSLLELGIKAYGAGAAAAVALSDAETVGGKAQDAVAAVPTLTERYEQTRYVVEHREEIQAALDYVNTHTPPQAELEDTIDRSTDTLDGIETTYGEVAAAKEAIDGIDSLNPFDAFDQTREAFGHVQSAWGARPELDSLRELAAAAEQASPYIDQVEVLAPVYYGGVFTLVDNFASDEVAGTLVVMALAFTVAFVLAQAVGFWVRRGLPGLIARTLQRWGASTFRSWYVSNLPYALSPPLYAAARERIERDIVTDLQGTLDPEALRELERYFADSPRGD
jgi:hypothetical protein